MLQPLNLSPRSARVQVVILAMVTLLSLPLLLLAWPEGGPSWWAQRRLFQNDVDGNPIASEDYAAANQGQLKNFAVSAYEDFLEKIPSQLGGIGDLRNPSQLPPNGGTGYRLREMVKKWVLLDEQSGAVLRNPDGTRRLASVDAGSVRNDFVALNLGQLKAVAKPFYDRLLELNANESEWLHPWNVDGGTANDFSPANLGQLKRVFSFDVKKDDDGDGLGNLEELNWKAIHGGSRNYDPNNPDMDEDGVLDGAEVVAGTDPLEFYNGANPVIRISAPHNKGLRNTVLEMPVAVRVYRKVVTASGVETAGEFLKNAPVSISVNMGSIALEENAPAEGWSVGSLDTKTDWNGWALVWVRLPDVIGKKYALTVRALNQTLQYPLETFPQLPPPVFGEVYEGMDGIVEVKAGVSGGVTTDVPIASTPGLKIHYRVDDPGVTESSSNTYSPGLVIAGTGNHTVHARAYAPGFEPSVAASKIVSASLNTFEDLNGKLPAYGMVSVMTAWHSPVVTNGSTGYFPFGYARFRPQFPDRLTEQVDLPLKPSGWYGASAAGYASPGREAYYVTAHPQVKPSAMGGVVVGAVIPSEIVSFHRTMAYGYDFNTKPFTVFYVSALHKVHNSNGMFLFGAGNSLFQFSTTRQLTPSLGVNTADVFKFGYGTLDANIAPMSTLARPSQARENQNFIAELSWDGQNLEGFYNGLRQYKHPYPLSRYGNESGVVINQGDKDFLNIYSEFACAVVYNRKLSREERAKVYAILLARQHNPGSGFVTNPPTVIVPSKATIKVPEFQDSDGDWLPDWRETELGSSITNTDSDGDGISDYAEACIFFTDPSGNDTDGDRMLDREEALLKNVNPYVSDGSVDFDGDGLSNFKEVLLKTNPGEKDSDGDGFEDGYEFNNGSSPTQHWRVPYLPISSVISHDSPDSSEGGGNGGNNDNGGGDTYPGGDESGTNPGIPSPAAGSVTLKLGVGDVSSSHSEDYEIIVREKVAGADWNEFFRHRSGGKGKYEEATYQMFNLENEYSFEIHRISGSDSGSDYDYRMVVAVDNTVPNPFNSRSFVLDQENILCDPEPDSLTTVDGYLTATGTDTDSLPDQKHNVTEEWINGSKKAKLRPVELVDTKDQAFDDLAPQGTTITTAMRDANIEPKATADERKERSIAWIEPHGEDNGKNGPDMPQLALRFRGAEQMGLKIKWKLQVIYERPRGTNPNEAQITAQDEVFIPKKANGTQPWKEEVLDGAVEFFNHADWISALQEKGFFGGEANLRYQLLKADGSALSTESTMLFSIGGKNPEDSLAKKYIDVQATAADALLTRLSYAVAKHESKDYNGTGSRYNQFWEGYARRFRHDHKRGHPLWCLSTDESSAGGFGVFQITGNLSSKYAIIPREQMWNWQKNTDAYITIIKTGGHAAKGSVMDRFIAAVASTYPSDTEAQNPPTNFIYDGGTYDAWEMGTITLYNGAGGCPQSRLKNPAGKWTILTNPWQFDPSRPAGSKWRYNRNSNNYLHEVIEQR